MKKLLPILLALLLLAGCTMVLSGENIPAEIPFVTTEPVLTAGLISSSSDPAATPTAASMATTQPENSDLLPEEMLIPVPTRAEEEEPLDRGMLFLGKPYYSPMPGEESCEEGNLYYWDPVTAHIHLITDRGIYFDPEIPVEGLAYSYKFDDMIGGYLLYVPADAPTELYAVPADNLSRHILIYTSQSGPITDLHICQFRDGSIAAEWVEDHRKLLRYTFSTGEAQVLMEQYYIIYANSEYRTWVTSLSGRECYLYNDSQVYFYGQCAEDSELSGYLYYRDVDACTKVPY